MAAALCPYSLYSLSLAAWDFPATSAAALAALVDAAAARVWPLAAESQLAGGCSARDSRVASASPVGGSRVAGLDCLEELPSVADSGSADSDFRRYVRWGWQARADSRLAGLDYLEGLRLAAGSRSAGSDFRHSVHLDL